MRRLRPNPISGICKCSDPKPVAIGAAHRCYACLRWIGEERPRRGKAPKIPPVSPEAALAQMLADAVARPAEPEKPRPARKEGLWKGSNKEQRVIHLRMRIARLEAELRELMEHRDHRSDRGVPRERKPPKKVAPDPESQ